ncbi:MAG: tetraacyldisaccharide 4'-kinase [Alphaproteobacteria bacterium]
MIKTPDFWYTAKPSPKARALQPIGRLYQFVTEHRLRSADPQPLDVPVVCVGNLVAGGSGKTPMVRYLVGQAKQMGIEAHVISRGYGGSITGPQLVMPTLHGADQIGDEPRELALLGCKVWVAKDRQAGAIAAARNGAELIILDDGLQSPNIHKDAVILRIDGGSGFGNGLGVPAGPLRSTIPFGMRQADLVVVLGEDVTNVSRHLPDDTPLITADLMTSGLQPAPTDDMPVYAVCGIARPERFRASLERAGFEVAGFEAFPDHHVLSPADWTRLQQAATDKGARLVVTMKDLARHTSFGGETPAALLVEMSVKDPDQHLAGLLQRLTSDDLAE